MPHPAPAGAAAADGPQSVQVRPLREFASVRRRTWSSSIRTPDLLNGRSRNVSLAAAGGGRYWSDVLDELYGGFWPTSGYPPRLPHRLFAAYRETLERQTSPN